MGDSAVLDDTFYPADLFRCVVFINFKNFRDVIPVQRDIVVQKEENVSGGTGRSKISGTRNAFYGLAIIAGLNPVRADFFYPCLFLQTTVINQKNLIRLAALLEKRRKGP